MMKVKYIWVMIGLSFSFLVSSTVSGQTVELSGDDLRDKIRGGLLGQMLGNLNGLPHEMQYIDEPGNVMEYIPALPEGARTDDDTDIEWLYIYIMQQQNEIFLFPQQITGLWKERINKGIWCSNRYSRHLMNLGFEPPYTSKFAFNPWAEFNISGQFVCETFALMAPGMPQTASRIGLNYTRVTIDMEPAQTTQFFCTMIATAFFEDDISTILDAGVSALDPKSEIREIAGNVRNWHQQYPGDWRKTRSLMKEKYTRYDGAMRDRNGYELNTAATIAALLYGQGDFSTTLMTAFNFGWDADNTAATAGTIVGTMKGYRWMLSQGWQIVDRYKNTKRENMPDDETITSFADRVIDLAEIVIVKNGGERVLAEGRPVYKIPVEQPANVQELPNLEQQIADLREEKGAEIESTIRTGSSGQAIAQAAYMAVCLDMAGDLKNNYPAQWATAVDSLGTYWRVMQNIFWDDDVPAIHELREKALAAGLQKPLERKAVW